MKLYEFSKKSSHGISWGTGFVRGSFSPKFLKISETKSLYTVKDDGKIALNFGWLNDNDNVTKYRDKFKKLMDKKELFKIPRDYKTHYPEYKIGLWYKKVDKLIDAIKALIEE